jgi:hypothetical protein
VTPPPPATPTAAPTILATGSAIGGAIPPATGTVTFNVALVSWTAVANATSYTLQRTQSGNSGVVTVCGILKQAPGGNTWCSDTGVLPGAGPVSYSYSASNASGPSPGFSPVSTPVSVDTTAFVYYGKSTTFSDAPDVVVPSAFKNGPNTSAIVQPLPTSPGGPWPAPLTGNSLPDGYGVISGVPSSGHVYVHAGFRYIDTPYRSIDFSSFEFVARPNAQYMTTGGLTPVTFNLTNLASWTATDTLDFADSNAGTFNSAAVFSPLLQQYPIGVPAPGATQLAGFTVDASAFGGLGNGLTVPDTSAPANDKPLFTQLSTLTSSGNVPYQTVNRIYNIPSMTIVDGRPLAINGAFTNVTTASHSLKYGRSVFQAQMPKVQPNAVAGGDTVAFWAEFVGGTAGAPHVSFNTVADIFALDVPAGTADVAAGSVLIGNPYPSTWAAMGQALESYSVTYNPPSLPASQQFFSIQALNTMSSMLAEAATSVGLHPHVYPVENLQVQATGAPAPVNAQQNQSGLGVNPTFSWNQSSVAGATPPNYYRLFVTGLNGGGGAQIFTSATGSSTTSITLPPGVFLPNTCGPGGVAGTCYYFIDVRAVNEPCRNAVQAPIAPRCTINEFAEVGTGLMSP